MLRPILQAEIRRDAVELIHQRVDLTITKSCQGLCLQDAPCAMDSGEDSLPLLGELNNLHPPVMFMGNPLHKSGFLQDIDLPQDRWVRVLQPMGELDEGRGTVLLECDQDDCRGAGESEFLRAFLEPASQDRGDPSAPIAEMSIVFEVHFTPVV